MKILGDFKISLGDGEASDAVGLEGKSRVRIWLKEVLRITIRVR